MWLIICGLLFVVLNVVGCATLFKTGHQLFIDSMDVYVDRSETVKQLEYFTGGAFANRNELTKVSKLEIGDFKYHYKKPNIFGRYCYYYLVVDKDTEIVKGWGFDSIDQVDPKKECGRSG